MDDRAAYQPIFDRSVPDRTCTVRPAGTCTGQYRG